MRFPGTRGHKKRCQNETISVITAEKLHHPNIFDRDLMQDVGGNLAESGNCIPKKIKTGSGGIRHAEFLVPGPFLLTIDVED